jgi:Ca-activated chloride channel homolog
VVIKPWSPDTPYLKKMAAAGGPDDAYRAYLTARKEYGTAPAFFLDSAEFFFARGATAYGLRALTNIAEMRLEDPQLLRIVAHRLAQLGYRTAALPLFEKILHLRPEEPQSYRDLALTLADHGDNLAKINPAAAVSDYKRAVALLNKVVTGRWDRFQGIELIALMEANRIVARAGNLPNGNTCAAMMDSRLVANLACDVRILLTWDTDQTDMDLWVTEPSGETAIYSHPRTTIGGRMSKDFTQGYGPEEYCLKSAMPGVYRIQTNYYGSSQQKLTGGTTVQATVITNFGRPTEKRQHLTLRLTKEQKTVEVGTIRW